MDSKSNDHGVSGPGQAAGGRGEKADVATVDAASDAAIESHAPQAGEVDDAGCFTEAYFQRTLPPIPDWMRKPPGPKEPSLFDHE